MHLIQCFLKHYSCICSSVCIHIERLQIHCSEHFQSISLSSLNDENLCMRILENGFLKLTNKEVGWWGREANKIPCNKTGFRKCVYSYRSASTKGEADCIEEKCQGITQLMLSACHFQD